MSPTLPDIQRTVDTREVQIKRVGVTNIKLPIQVRRHPGVVENDPSSTVTGRPALLNTVGTFELACELAATVKGTHMSRFTEVLNAHIRNGGAFSGDDLIAVALELSTKLESKRVYVKLEVDYFIDQPAPVTERPGVAPLVGILEVEVVKALDGKTSIITHTGVRVQGKTCCPCSREISDFDHETGRGKGAHAQRSNIDVRVQHDSTSTVWFEELVWAAWRSFSHPIYPVLKRPDERAITMGAYNNPKFVEDVVRDMSCQLRQMPKVRHYKVRVVNEESIHYHDAFAEVSA